MDVADHSRNGFDRIRYPRLNGLDPAIVALLHKSLVRIALMHLSIESAIIQVERSKRATLESLELLARLRMEGF